MTQVLDWVRMFGNAGAVANAAAPLEDKRTEDRYVSSLTRRVAATLPEAPAAARRSA